VILPNLPDVGPIGGTPNRPSRLLPGLEESRGALYEIGVSDDGTLVGLTKDEMDESLNNLRAMASSLGCDVELLRMVVVGTCQWMEDSLLDNQITRFGDLWVAEALVKPNHGTSKSISSDDLARISSLAPKLRSSDDTEDSIGLESLHSPTEQLRVSLTGATTSGKSSLLGTLSTATLDNGRGKSRLSLLKHRHELVSGVTSSVAQELIGYTRPQFGAVESDLSTAAVVNFASGNVSSWTDIHASADSGRLVFFSDSAGHPRYRRTTVRGLVGWAPHWTLLCVAADENSDGIGKTDNPSSAQSLFGTAVAGVDLSQAHLDLCLKLQIPLVVVITKLDLASKTGLRSTLGKVLSALKASDRRPLLLSAGANAIDTPRDSELPSISTDDWEDVQKALSQIKGEDASSVVPILLTSAVKGTGISKLHALLCNLPIPESVIPQSVVSENGYITETPPSSLFHIEEVFSLSSATPLSSIEDLEGGLGYVVGGHLRYGEIAVGNKLYVGPFPIDGSSPDIEDGISGSFNSMSFPGGKIQDGSPALYAAKGPSKRLSLVGSASKSEKNTEWRTVCVSSIRNLRLPVRRLLAGQVGTLGFVSCTPSSVEKHSRAASELRNNTASSLGKLRKGMVLAAHDSTISLTSSSTFTANFEDHALTALTIGTLVAAYIASIRATARIISLKTVKYATMQNPSPTYFDSPESDIFDFHDSLEVEEEEASSESKTAAIQIEFQFVTQREWIEPGTQVLIMPGATGQSLYGSHFDRVERSSAAAASAAAGLEGFVGRIV
jgi:GTPase